MMIILLVQYISNKMKINEIISERRKSLGITQKQLIEKIGIRHATLSEMETLKSIYNFVITRNLVGIIAIFSKIGTLLCASYITIGLFIELIVQVVFKNYSSWYFDNLTLILFIGLPSVIITGIIDNWDIMTEKKEKVQYINFKKELLG